MASVPEPDLAPAPADPTPPSPAVPVADRARRRLERARRLWDRVATGSDRLPISPWAGVVAVAISVYVVVFGTLTWRQQSNYGEFGFDMGIYDQSIWLLSRGRVPYNTIRGINYFGHHVNVITLVFVPLYWLGAGPHLLLLVQTVCLAAGAVPLYLLGRDLLARPLAAAAIAVAYLLHPTLEWINWWNFHPDAFIITPLLCCWLFARRGRWGLFVLCALIALTCKEDAAPAVLVIGVLVAVCWRRRVGLAIAAAAGAWFLLVTRVVIPHANGGVGPFYNDMFPALGDSPGSIARNAVVHPSRLWGLLSEHHRVSYYGRLLAPVGFVALVGLPMLLIAGPQTVINATSNQGYTYDSHYHYSSIAIAAMFLAVVEGCAFVGRRRPTIQGVLVATVIASAVMTNVAWSPSPVGRAYSPAIWARRSPRQPAVARAMAVIPASDGVSATYDIVTHIDHRRYIYEFPNPWVLQNWGIHGERPPDVGTVDWLLLDQPVPARLQPVLTYLTGPGGEFELVLQGSGVTLARRVRPPTEQQFQLPEEPAPEPGAVTPVEAPTLFRSTG